MSEIFIVRLIVFEDKGEGAKVDEGLAEGVFVSFIQQKISVVFLFRHGLLLKEKV